MLSPIRLASYSLILLGLLRAFLAPSSSIMNSVQSSRPAHLNPMLSDVIWVPDNYSTIQQAVNAASSGDTIIVRAGLYYENAKVNRTVTLLGEGFPVIDGSQSIGQWGDGCLGISADNVTVNGFVLQHTPPLKMSEIGLGLSGCGYANVSQNVFRFSRGGISMSTANHDHVISDNLFEDLVGAGISCAGINITLSNNTVVSSGTGIAVHSPLNTLINNTLMNNEAYGIYLNAYLVTMKGNKMIGNLHNFMTVEMILPQLVNDIDTTNTVNDKPVYYWINQSDREVPSDAGYVALINCTNITVEDLNLSDNGQSVLIAYSSNCTVRDCSISNNEFGIFMSEASNNTIHHNNLINNTFQVGNTDSWFGHFALPPNTWTDGYPSGGNYWSSHVSNDTCSGMSQNETGSDAVSDTAYVINENNTDNYPFMAPIDVFNAGVWNSTLCKVHVVSNSTVSNFQLNMTEQTLRFNVTGEAGLGFSRVTIPSPITQTLWQNNWTVLVDNQPPIEIRNWTDTGNAFIYFIYECSEHQVTIIPEFLSTAILSSTLLLTPFILVISKKQSSRRKTTTGNSC